jgi:hypothetical protein
MDFLTYCDGISDLLSISESIDQEFEALLPIVEVLLNNSIIEEKIYE